MAFDLNMIKAHYEAYGSRLEKVRNVLNRPLTLSEKILFTHARDVASLKNLQRGKDYGVFRPDRICMQDATAQMALLQFMNTGMAHTAVPTTVHLDHLIRAEKGATTDLAVARQENQEVYTFLRTAASKYGIGFWDAGAGIIHQVVLENYAFPGGMMVGTDSHTPNAGGLGMIAIGVGGADAVDVMTDMDWELRLPRIMGVRLRGKLSPWASAKDIILHLCGKLTTKGGTNYIIEYFGEGTKTLPATAKATICNMGAEVGATTSVFPLDEKMKDYLISTHRKDVATLLQGIDLKADIEVENQPERYYDTLVDINLSEVEPHVNGPFTPDAACPISQMSQRVEAEGFPEQISAALIGSCTNSSYQDISRAASLLQEALQQGFRPKAKLYINPGSERTRATLCRDGVMDVLQEAGAIVLTNACGPCIGQWRREGAENNARNTIVTSFNRNFVARADGNHNTHAFVCSPEIVTAFALSGSLTFNPLTDFIRNEDGRTMKLPAPYAEELPCGGFEDNIEGFIAPNSEDIEVEIPAGSDRLQRLKPFDATQVSDFQDMRLLIKVKGKCTTDHISKAGPWLRYRGHLENISQNLLLGATNAFTNEVGKTLNLFTLEKDTPAAVSVSYKQRGIGSVVVAEENYGEGSSREHAAMEPRYVGVRVVVAKSFARIHETNLKKQGVLALTFVHPEDYDLIEQGDSLSINIRENFNSDSKLLLTVKHEDGSQHQIPVNHTYGALQIAWLWAGSALGYMKSLHTN